MSRGSLWTILKPKHKVQSNAFDVYKFLLYVKHDSIVMRWIIYLNTCVEHLAFDVKKQHIWDNHFNLQTHEVSYVMKDDYVIAIT
jgi:hypothetical protein